MSEKKPRSQIQADYRAKRKHVQAILTPEEYSKYYNYVTKKNISMTELFRRAANDYIAKNP
jgi:hypothetical protein